MASKMVGGLSLVASRGYTMVFTQPAAELDSALLQTVPAGLELDWTPPATSTELGAAIPAIAMFTCKDGIDWLLHSTCRD